MKIPNYKGRYGSTRTISTGLLAAATVMLNSGPVMAIPLPGGTLDPTTIPKYVTPLVIPPVMPKNTSNGADYEIAVRQFQQQILPTGFPTTTVMSYGEEGQPSTFYYPAFTVENTVDTPTVVNWHNELVVDAEACNANPVPSNKACNFVTSLSTIDRGIHWANPEQLTCADPGKTKDCRPDLSNGKILTQPYNGPIPTTVHVHGAHVNPDSDGYPEAWWLPNAQNIPVGYATQGTLVNQYGTVTNSKPGIAKFTYRNDQPSTTLWYHDHTLGITRNNVYSGMAGFWLIRKAGGGEDGVPVKNSLGQNQYLPGPAPVAGEDTTVVANYDKYREIPILIQDRSFNADGSLFYPANRAFFEGLGDGQTPGNNGNVMAGMKVDTIGTGAFKGKKKWIPNNSDILTNWNPEAFFNTMVVNGSTWPKLDVADAEYRFRLLNGCNSRFLNLAMFVVNNPGTPDESLGEEVPFYQIGGDQSIMPKVVKVMTGGSVELPGPDPVTGAASDLPIEPYGGDDAAKALLVAPAERHDVIVDFSGLPNGTVIRMINTGGDDPYGGFPLDAADPATSGQVMQFVVKTSLKDTTGASNTDTTATKPWNLTLSLPDQAEFDEASTNTRDQAVLEEISQNICAFYNMDGTINQDYASIPDPNSTVDGCMDAITYAPSGSFVAGPAAAVLGVNGSGDGTPTMWADPIKTAPTLNTTETWELWNHTEDAHPLHIHLVKFRVMNREPFDPATSVLGGVRAPERFENGWKDTVVAYPSEVTRVKAKYDIAGLYVWHCHILEHEDNEMMVPFCVNEVDAAGNPIPGSGAGCNAVP